MKGLWLEIKIICIAVLVLLLLSVWAQKTTGFSWEANHNRTVSIDVSEGQEDVKRVYSIKSMAPCLNGEGMDAEGALVSVLVGPEVTIKTEELIPHCYIIDTEKIGEMRKGTFYSAIKKTWGKIISAGGCKNEKC